MRVLQVTGEPWCCHCPCVEPVLARPSQKVSVGDAVQAGIRGVFRPMWPSGLEGELRHALATLNAATGVTATSPDLCNNRADCPSQTEDRPSVINTISAAVSCR